MNRFISQKFRFYSFISIALLLFVHGYNLEVGYLMPFSIVNEPLTLTTFTEYLFANGLLRFRIPMLFIISGYIFAMQDNKPYVLRIKNRFVTLMIPYFIWSAVGLAITYWLQQYPITAKVVFDSQLDQLGDNRPYSQIGWGGVLHRWLFVPISFQLWFIRTLFFYNLCYPIIRWLVKKYAITWFALLFFLWLTIFNIFIIEGQGLFFFSLGIWLYKTNYRIDKTPRWFSYYLSWLFFVGLCIIRTFMAFELESYSTASMLVMSLLYVSSAFAGVVAIWFSGDAVVKYFMQQKWFVWASAFSFVIFGLHVPLIAYTMQMVLMIAHNIPNYRLLSYLIVPVLVLLFCIAAGAVLRAVLPKLYRIATGGRGF